jgi:hypothetical protein
MKMKTIISVCSGIAIAMLISGCATRSISDTGYYGHPGAYAGAGGELDEFDVLGIRRDQAVSEEEIARAGAAARHVALKARSSVLLVQSGTLYPDGPMVAELQKHFEVVPFSGVGAQPANAGVRPVYTNRGASPPYYSARYETDGGAAAGHPEYSKLLRLAAARAGADNIICYWGIVESADEKLATRSFAWLPVANWVVPNTREHLRLRLKVAVIDVRTGSWSVFSPEPVEQAALSASARKEIVAQKQVESLKARAYAAGANELVRRYVD